MPPGTPEESSSDSYSPKSLEGEFSEVPLRPFLESSPRALRGGIMLAV